MESQNRNQRRAELGEYWKVIRGNLFLLDEGNNNPNYNLVMEGDGTAPRIQGVSRYLRSMGFETFYTPQFISFGPFHFTRQLAAGSPKTLWTAAYLKETNRRLHDVYARINIDSLLYELWESYSPTDSELYYEDENFKWMLMVDGCSILHVIDKSCNSSDPAKELQVSMERLVRVHKDMLLLENQIPFKLLRIICNDEAKLNMCLQNFLKIHGVTSVTGKQNIGMEETSTASTSAARGVSKSDHQIIKIGDEDTGDPIHLLHYLHIVLRMKSDEGGQLQLNKKSLNLRRYRVGSIHELKKAAVRIQKHPNDAFVHPVFDSSTGILQLPKLTLNDTTVVMFLNLVAYEMCPDFRSNFSITSYMVFLSSLIDKPEDVKELRSCGVLINELAGDKEVVNLFNRMDALLVPETNIYADITYRMQQHFVSNHNKIKMFDWLEEAYSSFLRSPWTIIALLAATLGLTLTFIQTWFTVHPKGS